MALIYSFAKENRLGLNKISEIINNMEIDRNDLLTYAKNIALRVLFSADFLKEYLINENVEKTSLSPRVIKSAAKTFFDKAIGSCSMLEKIVIDKSGSNLSALRAVNNSQAENEKIEIRQIKYLNNIVEQDHRFIKK